MCIAHDDVPINQNGMIYDSEKIDALLMQQDMAKKIRMSGGRLKSNPKLTGEQDDMFKQKLRELLR